MNLIFKSQYKFVAFSLKNSEMCANSTIVLEVFHATDKEEKPENNTDFE